MKTMVLYPYLLGSTWVFDDPATGLKEEAFVLGASEIITKLVNELLVNELYAGFSSIGEKSNFSILLGTGKCIGAVRGVKLTFSDEPFDGAQLVLSWNGKGEETFYDAATTGTICPFLLSGDWYKTDHFGPLMFCWLCPALLRYFDAPPLSIYARVDPLPEGVDPVWHVARGEAFVRPSQQGGG